MATPSPNIFRVSSALKTIIGKELITNDFIAVFELVKNSFDAHAKRVDVIFEDIYGDDPHLIIWDDGKGMDKTDIIEKWLFVAYSAKKEGTEDYRDKIKSKRIHAGAKGIGRFSCDKLGSKLAIYSRKRRNAGIGRLKVNWEDFEKDSKKEFIEIPVKYKPVNNISYESFGRGTILEITGLREKWDREKLIKLKRSLEKLINPNQENDPGGFSIYLQVDEELDKDKEVEAKGRTRDTVNGIVENRIFENLQIKTTKINSVISEDGEIITTILEDRGTLIYKVIEQNPYKKHLHNIQIHLFVLNRSAKATFARLMGIPSVQYGSVFLYKNGFRIYPFGEPDQDTLGIDHRKQQGTSRFFGTRDIIGRIEINGSNDTFQETSSRDGGLIRNLSYEKLEEFFKEYLLKRLEKFAIGVIKWGNAGDLLDHEKLSPAEMKKQASGIVYNLARSDDIIDIEYNPRLIDILQDRTINSLKTILSNLQRVAEQTDNQLIVREIKRAQRQYKSLLKDKEEAEAETRRARKKTEETEKKAKKSEEEKEKVKQEAKEAKEEARQKTSQNLFLQSVMTQDLQNIISLNHHIGISSVNISNYIENLIEDIQGKKFVPTKTINRFLEKISYQANIISSIAKFSTKARFNLESYELEEPLDLISFIKEHMLNVCWDFINDEASQKLEIEFIYKDDKIFEYIFKPIEITIIIDNLINNSRKAGATNVIVQVLSCTKKRLEISFKDNGHGIPASNSKKIFHFGFSTTEGSGLGLFHVNKILDEMGGAISLNTDCKNGTEFMIRFNK